MKPSEQGRRQLIIRDFVKFFGGNNNIPASLIDTPVHTVQPDSFAVKPGDVWFPNHPYHSNSLAWRRAKSNGAILACLSSTVSYTPDMPYIKIPLPYNVDPQKYEYGYDPIKAQFVDYIRQKFCRDKTVIVVTGVYGKTGTVKMIGDVLKQKYKVAITSGEGLENIPMQHIPTMVELINADIGVFECSSLRSHAWRDCRCLSPDIVVVLTTEKNNSYSRYSDDNVFFFKISFLELLAESGIGVINCREERMVKWAKMRLKNTLFVGDANPHDYFASNKTSLGFEGEKFDLTLSGETIKDIYIPNAFGNFYGDTASFAGAIAKNLGLTTDQIRAGLESYTPVRFRPNVRKTAYLNILEDVWSLSGASIYADIETLAKCDGRKVFIYGFVVPDASYEVNWDYAQIAKTCFDHGIDVFIFHGSGEDYKAVQSGYPNAVYVADFGDFAKALRENVFQGDYVCVKGHYETSISAITNSLLEFVPDKKIPLSLSDSFCILNTRTNQIIHEKNARKKSVNCSCNALATAVIVAESGVLDFNPMKQLITVASVDRFGYTWGATVGLGKGEIISAKDAFYALLVCGVANDLAVALAGYVSEQIFEGGPASEPASLRAFTSRMRELANKLGMQDTYFDFPGSTWFSYSTAYDAAILMRYAMSIPEVKNALKLKAFEFQSNKRNYNVKSKQNIGNTSAIFGTCPIVRENHYLQLKVGASLLAFNDDAQKIVSLQDFKTYFNKQLLSAYREAEYLINWDAQ